MDGKVKSKSKGSASNISSQQQQQQSTVSTAEAPARGIPNYEYKKGKLMFARAKTLNTNPEEPMVNYCPIYNSDVL